MPETVCRTLSALVFVGLLAKATLLVAATVPNPDDGGAGSIRPHIPEPLFFDLVRPLGARPGEFEVNTLFRRSLSSGRLEWAPEIEYALPRGWALEFELPMEGTQVSAYKAAAQKTVGTLRDGRYIHGWQGFVEWDTHGGARWSTTQVYISGYRFNSRWSSLSLHGVQVADSSSGRLAGVANNSVFYDVNARWVTGVETNFLRGRRDQGVLRVLPQVHLSMPAGFTLQMSVGLESRPLTPVRPRAVAAWRLIREL
jgi:hypothetical protein